MVLGCINAQKAQTLPGPTRQNRLNGIPSYTQVTRTCRVSPPLTSGREAYTGNTTSRSIRTGDIR